MPFGPEMAAGAARASTWQSLDAGRDCRILTLLFRVTTPNDFPRLYANPYGGVRNSPNPDSRNPIPYTPLRS